MHVIDNITIYNIKKINDLNFQHKVIWLYF